MSRGSAKALRAGRWTKPAFLVIGVTILSLVGLVMAARSRDAFTVEELRRGDERLTQVLAPLACEPAAYLGPVPSMRIDPPPGSPLTATAH